MQYKYCENDNYEDLSCGRVIIHKSGFTNFPVRLAQEIFCRCLSYSKNKNNICIYDPCCGGGYLLTVLGYLNPGTISKIIASDINNEAVQLANDNLNLLNEKGLEQRIIKLQNLYSLHRKDSYLEALNSANSMLSNLKNVSFKINTRVFKSDILIENTLINSDFKVDIVIVDVPYGNLVSWQGTHNENDILLNNILPVLNDNSIVAVCSDKKQKFCSCNYRRLEKQIIGKRKFEIFTNIVK